MWKKTKTKYPLKELLIWQHLHVLYVTTIAFRLISSRIAPTSWDYFVSAANIFNVENDNNETYYVN